MTNFYKTLIFKTVTINVNKPLQLTSNDIKTNDVSLKWNTYNNDIRVFTLKNH